MAVTVYVADVRDAQDLLSRLRRAEVDLDERAPDRPSGNVLARCTGPPSHRFEALQAERDEPTLLLRVSDRYG